MIESKRIKLELLIQEMFQIRVSTVFQVKYMLLMHPKGILLHILVQQGQKKQRTSNIWACPEILQPNVQGASVYVTSGDDGTVQSRDCGGLSACASNLQTSSPLFASVLAVLTSCRVIALLIEAAMMTINKGVSKLFVCLLVFKFLINKGVRDL